MPDLSGAGVRVLLIGASGYTSLPELPSVRTSLDALATGMIEHCGVARSSLRVVHDPSDDESLITEISRAATEAETVLLIYFLGHGRLDADGGLGLAAITTDEAGRAARALPYRAVAEAVGHSRAWNRLVILDCCFSGRAQLWPAQLPPDRPAAGSYLIASAEKYALAPVAAEYTLFTGAFLDLLANGDPDCGPRITVEDAYRSLRRRLPEPNRPLRQIADASGALVLTANRAPRSRRPAREPSRPPSLPLEPGSCPYPGLRPFDETEAALFHGRDELTEQLLQASQDAADDRSPLIVVGAPGVGKTSLLRAGLIPARPERAAIWLTSSQIWSSETDQVQLIVIDQLEEAFGRAPDRIGEFVERVLELAARPGTSVVLALRSDHYARAAHHPALVRALNRHRFDVPALTEDQLHAAIGRPAAAAGSSFENGLIETILAESRPGSLPLLAHTLNRMWAEKTESDLTRTGYDRVGRLAGSVAQSLDSTLAALTEAEVRIARQALPRLIRTGDDLPETTHPLDLDEVGGPDAEPVLHAFAAAGLLTLTDEPERTVRTVRIRYDVLIRSWPVLRLWRQQDQDWLTTRRQLQLDASTWASSTAESGLYRGRHLKSLRTAIQNHGGPGELESESANFYLASLHAQTRSDRRRTRWITALATAVVFVLVTGVMAYGSQRHAHQQRDIVSAQLLGGEADRLRSASPGLSRQLALLAYRADRKTGAPAVLSAQAQPAGYDQGEPTVDLATSADGRLTAIATGSGLRLWDTRGGRLAQVDGISVGALAVGSRRHFAVAATGPADQADRRTHLTIWRIGNPRRPERIAEIPTGPAELRTIAVSADEMRVATGSADGRLTVWELNDLGRPRPIATARPATTALFSLVFTPDGHSLIGSTEKGTTIWDVSSPGPATVRATIGTSFVPSLAIRGAGASTPVQQRLAIDPTGRYLAAPADGDRLRIWDLTDPGAPEPLPIDHLIAGDCSTIDGIVWVSENLVVSCGADPISYAFHPKADPLHRLERRGTFRSGRSSNSGGPLAVRNDHGRFVLNAGGDGVMSWPADNLWQPGALESLPARAGLLGHPVSLARAPSGDQLMADGSFFGYNRLTDLTRASVLGNYRVYYGTTAQQRLDQTGLIDTGPVLSPDGKVLATTEAVGTHARVSLRLTSTPAAAPVATLSALDNGVRAMVFSADSSRLAVVDNTTASGQAAHPSSVKLYSVHNPARPRLLSTTRVTDPHTVALSPDGRLIIVFTGTALLSWNISAPARPVPLPSRTLPRSAGSVDSSFSADGKLLFQSGGDAVWLWAVRAGRVLDQPTRLARPDWPAIAALSPDGTTVAVVQNDSGEIRVDLWDIADPADPRHQSGWNYGGGIDSEYAVAFTSNGRSLMIGLHNTLSLWSMDPALISGQLCQNAGDPITRREWKTYVPGYLSYDPPCAS
jgi:WD40 repeat protein